MLRCGRCGAEASEWAARCPRCRARLDVAVPAIETPGDEPAPHPQAPGRHRGRRLVGAGVALAVVAVMLLAVHVLTNGGRRAPVLAGYSLVAVDPDTDTVLVKPAAGPGHAVRGLPAGVPGPMMAVGQSLVVVASGTVYSVTPAVSGDAVRVAAGDAFFPSVWPEVFGYVQDGGAPLDGSVIIALAQAGAEAPMAPGEPGAPFPASATLPPGYRPEAHLGSAFVVSEPQDAGRSLLGLWAPGPPPGGTLLRTFGRVHAVVGIRDTTVAWLAQEGCDGAGECPLHLTDVSSGADRTVAPPPGHDGFEAGGAFSPDGRRLAAFVGGPPRSHPVAQLVVVDVQAPASSAVRPVQGATIAVGEPRGFATWTPDGAYVLFCGVEGTVHAWSVESGATLDTGLPASYDVLAF